VGRKFSQAIESDDWVHRARNNDLLAISLPSRLVISFNRRRDHFIVVCCE